MSSGATYSTARASIGPSLFISGQVPTDADGAIPHDFEQQAQLVLSKIHDVLTEHGLDWGSALKVTYYLKDIGNLGSLRNVILETIPEPRPAATLVEVSAFFDPGIGVEIDAIADLGHRDD